MIRFKEGFYADVRTEDCFRTRVSYKAGILEELKTRREKQAFLRVYDGRLWYYASVTDVDHLQKTLDGLYAAAERGATGFCRAVFPFCQCSAKMARFCQTLAKGRSARCFPKLRFACLGSARCMHFAKHWQKPLKFAKHWQNGNTQNRPFFRNLALWRRGGICSSGIAAQGAGWQDAGMTPRNSIRRRRETKGDLP